jgi:acetyltransferase/esterase
MSRLSVPGAQISYEVSGSGPLLILIAGARGDGEVFQPLVPHLISQYRVVTYDRRGFSQSMLDGPQDEEHRLTTDADDVRRLIEHLTDQPAIIFGNSSGAIVALEVITRFPEHVQIAVAHEPPAVKLLPDAAHWLAVFDEIYDTYRAEGVARAMQQFGSLALGSTDRQVMERARREHSETNIMPNAVYWLEHELRQYPRVELDLMALTANVERIILVGGHDAKDRVAYQPNMVLAKLLGGEVIDFPGGHLGFMASPAEFAAALLHALGDE